MTSLPALSKLAYLWMMPETGQLGETQLEGRGNGYEGKNEEGGAERRGQSLELFRRQHVECLLVFGYEK